MWALINSNDFGRLENYLADSNSNFGVVDVMSKKKKNNSIFCVFGARSHAM